MRYFIVNIQQVPNFLHVIFILKAYINKLHIKLVYCYETTAAWKANYSSFDIACNVFPVHFEKCYFVKKKLTFNLLKYFDNIDGI